MPKGGDQLKKKEKLAESRDESTVGKLRLQASSFVIGELEHPNMMPFSGTLTFFDAPSDMAPHGSGGRKVLIPSEVGVPALSSLKGMAVNYVEGSMNDHSPQDKIGIITDAYVGARLEDGGMPVNIEGYIYALDFEEAATSIKLNQDNLGFSYETTQTVLTDGLFNGQQVAVVSDLGFFVGASVLWKESAAYHSTSLVASAEEEMEGNLLELKDVMDAINDLKASFETRFEHLEKHNEEESSVQASAEDESQVETVVDEATNEQEANEDVDPIENVEQVEEASEEPVVEQAEVKDEVVPSSAEQTVETVEANLNASAELQKEVEALKAELAQLKATADIQATARKSFAYPTQLLSKYETNGDTTESLFASIDNNEDLSVEERLALKFEAMAKTNKK